MFLKAPQLIHDTDIDVALIRTGALGDICMTLPLVRRLRQHLTGKITWVIDKKFYPLVKGCEGINFIPIDKPRSIYAYYKLRKLFRKHPHDVLLLPQSSLRTNLMSMLFPSKRKIGNGRLHSRNLQWLFVREGVSAFPEHLVDVFMRFSEPFGIDKGEGDSSIILSAEEKSWAQSILSSEKKLVAICPLATKVERTWPAERIVKVMRSFLEDEVEFVLIGDHQASSVNSMLDSSVLHTCHDFSGKHSLRELAAVLHRCDVLLSPDTGPMHVADAVGTPTVGLFAVSPASKTGPYQYKKGVIDKYKEALSLLNLKIENVSWRKRVHKKKAIELIEVEEVVDKIHDVLYKNFS